MGTPDFSVPILKEVHKKIWGGFIYQPQDQLVEKSYDRPTGGSTLNF